MAFNTHTFKLDLTPGASRQVLYTSQGDIGRPFEAQLYWNGSTWSADGTTARVRGKKPDETVFDYSVTVDGYRVTFDTTEQMTIISGPVECELVFSQGGDVIASANFLLIVEDSPYNPNAPSTSDISGIGTNAIEDAAITTAKIADGAVATAKLADNSVTSAKIKDGEVKTADIADANVTTAKLAANAVTTGKVTDGAVTTVKLADGSVTNAKIADNSISTAKIENSAITTDKLANVAVTSDKIANGSLLTVDYSDQSVTRAKLSLDIQDLLAYIPLLWRAITNGYSTIAPVVTQGALAFSQGDAEFTFIN